MLRHKASILIAQVVVLLGANSAPAQQPFFMGLGDLTGGSNSYAYDISADGRVVVGGSGASLSFSQNRPDSKYSHEYFRWTRESEMIGLGALVGFHPRVSADGLTIVGNQRFYLPPVIPGGPLRARDEMFRWTSATGL